MFPLRNILSALSVLFTWPRLYIRSSKSLHLSSCFMQPSSGPFGSLHFYISNDTIFVRLVCFICETDLIQLRISMPLRTCYFISDTLLI